MNGQPGLPGLPGTKVYMIEYCLLSFLLYISFHCRVNVVKLLLQQLPDHKAIQVQKVLLVYEVHPAYQESVCYRSIDFS